MQGREDIGAVRREILDLLRQQMEALDSPLGLTDAVLSQCYERQARVQELREKLQAAASLEPGIGSTPHESSAAAEPSSGVAPPAVVARDNAANV